MEVHRVSHVGICVSDIDRSLQFYRDGLGFELMSKYEIDKAFGRVMELDDMVGGKTWMIGRDGMTIEFLHYDSPPVEGDANRRRMNERGFTHLCVYVDDVDAVAARLVELGGAVYDVTRTEVNVDDIKGNWVYCTDPDGVRIELIAMPGR
jgi:lactoylglutathione lyase